jgi:hypothetical protein
LWCPHGIKANSGLPILAPSSNAAVAQLAQASLHVIEVVGSPLYLRCGGAERMGMGELGVHVRRLEHDSFMRKRSPSSGSSLRIPAG